MSGAGVLLNMQKSLGLNFMLGHVPGTYLVISHFLVLLKMS